VVSDPKSDDSHLHSVVLTGHLIRPQVNLVAKMYHYSHLCARKLGLGRSRDSNMVLLALASNYYAFLCSTWMPYFH
jgi:hypothetical protein